MAASLSELLESVEAESDSIGFLMVVVATSVVEEVVGKVVIAVEVVIFSSCCCCCSLAAEAFLLVFLSLFEADTGVIIIGSFKFSGSLKA